MLRESEHLHVHQHNAIDFALYVISMAITQQF